MHEGKFYTRVPRDHALPGMIVVSILMRDNALHAWVGRRRADIETATSNWVEEQGVTDIPAALQMAADEVGSPGIETVAVYFEDDEIWDPAWGVWGWAK